MSVYRLLCNKLKKSKNTGINNINSTEIDDIKNIKINTDIPSEQRILDFINKVKNPYIVKVNDTVVKMTYSSNDVKAINCIKKIINQNL